MILGLAPPIAIFSGVGMTSLLCSTVQSDRGTQRSNFKQSKQRNFTCADFNCVDNMSQPAVTDYFKIQKKEAKAKRSVLEKQTVRDELTKVLSEAGIPAIPIKKEDLSQNLRDIQDSLKKVWACVLNNQEDQKQTKEEQGLIQVKTMEMIKKLFDSLTGELTKLAEFSDENKKKRPRKRIKRRKIHVAKEMKQCCRPQRK